MIKRLFSCVREYKRPTLITLVLIVCEAVIETFIPFITANLVNNIKRGVDMGVIIRTGVVLVIMAIVSLS